MEIVSLVLDREPLIDVFAYRGFLVGWNFESQLLIYKVDSIIDDLGAKYGDEGLSAAYALFCSRGIGATPRMKSAFRSRTSNSNEVLTLQTAPVARVRQVGPFDHVVDMHITYNRLYLATETGLSIGWFDPELMMTEHAHNSTIHHEGECLAVSVGMRAVGASFGADGLFVISNESSEVAGPRRDWLVPLQSVRSSIGGSTLANFPSQEEMQTIPIRVDRDRRDRAVLAEVDFDASMSSDVRTIETDGYLFWDTRGRRAFDVDDERENPSGRWWSDASRLESGRSVNRSSTIHSASFTGNNILAVETSDGVAVSKDGEEREVQAGPVISMRTYRNSWRYRRLISSTSASGVGLHAALEGDADRG